MHCNEDSFRTEINTIKTIARNHGYKHALVNKILKELKRRHNATLEEDPPQGDHSIAEQHSA